MGGTYLGLRIWGTVVLGATAWTKRTPALLHRMWDETMVWWCWRMTRRPARGGKKARVAERECWRLCIWNGVSFGLRKRRPFWMDPRVRNGRSNGVKWISWGELWLGWVGALIVVVAMTSGASMVFRLFRCLESCVNLVTWYAVGNIYNEFEFMDGKWVIFFYISGVSMVNIQNEKKR